MTGEEFMFLSKSATTNSNLQPTAVVVDATSPKYVYGLSGIAYRQPTASRKAVKLIKQSSRLDAR